MKLTEMIHQTVVAFEPKRHPVYALIALAMFLAALVALAYFGSTGTGALIKGMA